MRWFDAALHDVRAACRIMRQSPLLSGATIATLALGIGPDPVGALRRD